MPIWLRQANAMYVEGVSLFGFYLVSLTFSQKILEKGCYGLNCVPPKKVCWNPKPQYFRMGSYLEIELLQIQFRWGHFGDGVGCPCKKVAMWRQRHTGKMPHDDKGRDGSYTAASQGTPKMANKSPETANRQGGIPYRFQRERGPLKPWFQNSTL